MSEIPPLCGYFRIAKRTALQSEYRIQMGAVLVDKRPICTGFNKLKSHPKFANPAKHIKISIHAEIDCLLKAKKDVRGTEIYVYREYRNGIPAMARPCPNCIQELKRAGIRKIFYSIPVFPFWNSELL